ncbi:MAG TPA: hypothetical protein VJ731_06595 [Terriglobales bacterium]|nr:hypothetical protein [Terriglobales bacterium]
MVLFPACQTGMVSAAGLKLVSVAGLELVSAAGLKLVSAAGLELEAFSRRPSREPKSRA